MNIMLARTIMVELGVIILKKEQGFRDSLRQSLSNHVML
jgi:hypothetical protein